MIPRDVGNLTSDQARSSELKPSKQGQRDPESK
jgi:hypothetical protein